jgi:hypothetical protein
MLPRLLTSAVRAPAAALGVIEGEPRCEGWNPRLRSTIDTAGYPNGELTS